MGVTVNSTSAGDNLLRLRPAGWTWVFPVGIFGSLALILAICVVAVAQVLHQQRGGSAVTDWAPFVLIMIVMTAIETFAYTRAAPPVVELQGQLVVLRFGPVPIKQFALSRVGSVRRAVFAPTKGLPALRKPRPLLQFVSLSGDLLSTLWADLYEPRDVETFLAGLRLPIQNGEDVSHVVSAP